MRPTNIADSTQPEPSPIATWHRQSTVYPYRSRCSRSCAFSYPQLSKAAQHLLHVMLRPAPSDRIALDDILSHPWFLPIESRLRSVNADLICRPDGAAAPCCRCAHIGS